MQREQAMARGDSSDQHKESTAPQLKSSPVCLRMNGLRVMINTLVPTLPT